MSDDAPHHRLTAAPRRTVRGPVEVRGVGLFTGRPSSLRIVPRSGPAASGIVFVRVDLPGSPCVESHVRNVAPERRRTLLATNGATRAEVHTVEHVLSALAGLGVTDATIELDGAEVPIGDGSATPFAEAIEHAGVRDLGPHEAPALAPIVVTQPIVVADAGGEIVAEPLDPACGHRCEMTYELDYGPASPIAPQSATLRVGENGAVPGYGAEIARARTFCLVEEAIAMRQMGLFKDFEPKDLLVIGKDGPIDNAYRFPNEPARHKLLDMLGDLSLAGRPIHAKITAKRSGHALNHQMAAALARLE